MSTGSKPTSLNPTPRTRVVREPQRAVYDRDAINQILDEAFLCHVGFVADGQPFVIPTSYGRNGDVLYIHGSAASRMLRNLDQGVPVCVTVTLLDGLVLARSVFNHSMNYRSVVILGTATLVNDSVEKLAALRALSEHIIPHRWDDSRQPNEKELKATSVLRLPIDEFSAKVRVGPPVDDEEDYAFPTWAGVIPLELNPGDADPRRTLPARAARLPEELFAPEQTLDRRSRHLSHGTTRVPLVQQYGGRAGTPGSPLPLRNQLAKNPITFLPGFLFAVWAMPAILDKAHVGAGQRFLCLFHLPRFGSRIVPPMDKSHRHLQFAELPFIEVLVPPRTLSGKF